MSQEFKVLFVFVNDRMRTYIPLNISYLSAVLKAKGFQTRLFDTSFYTEQERLADERKKEAAGIFRPIDYSGIGVKLNNGSLLADLKAAIRKERPSLVAFSVFSQSKGLVYRLSAEVRQGFPGLKIIFGGIHVNIAPEESLREGRADYVCLGEGENALRELCERLAEGQEASDIKNLAYLKDGKIVFNPCREPVDLDSLPFPDWDLFPEYHQYGPYRGKLLKMSLVEYSRTCPYHCAYCGNNVYKQYYKAGGHKLAYRYKSPERWVEEMKLRKQKYGSEFINIADGTFIAQPEGNLERLAELYVKEVGLPFFCDGTVHCVTPKKLQLLKRMGCVCLNLGLESGNEEYRKKYLDRSMTNERIVSAFLMTREAGIDTRSYNIIGLPYETRGDIFQTIEMNRKCKVGSMSLSIFMPYEGTALRELCIKEGLIGADREITGDGTEPIIKNPNLSDEDLVGIYNTFALYVKAPKVMFPVIRMAEGDSLFARELRANLMRLYLG